MVQYTVCFNGTNIDIGYQLRHMLETLWIFLFLVENKLLAIEKIVSLYYLVLSILEILNRFANFGIIFDVNLNLSFISHSLSHDKLDRMNCIQLIPMMD